MQRRAPGHPGIHQTTTAQHLLQVKANGHLIAQRTRDVTKTVGKSQSGRNVNRMLDELAVVRDCRQKAWHAKVISGGRTQYDVVVA
jgi:ABC-type uncharacterized transport system ATPase subunit